MTWKIQAVTGDLAGQEISIERDMLVGRHQSADIVLQQAEISRKHAAFLLKDAAKLGLTEEFGARHLAGAPEGRGLHWRTFTAALDEIALTVEEEERVVAGAEAAFRAVHAYAQQRLG